MQFAHDFQTILGRNLVGELKNFVHRPFLVVTMEDMWPKFKKDFEGAEYFPYFVKSVDEQVLQADLTKLPTIEAVVGLGGGMAIDTAKYFSWRKHLPLFQVQTALSMNASWGQRTGVRIDGVVRYIGWAVPEAVYIDYDVIRGAPRQLNYSGIGDIIATTPACSTGNMLQRLVSASRNGPMTRPSRASPWRRWRMSSSMPRTSTT
jgi:glycerol-1-phosphate dehydrogenase [NAD(P)+]